MKKILTLALVAVVMALMPACTQNNGYIGDFFGSWVLKSADVDGQLITDPDGCPMTWSFQRNIIMITVDLGAHRYQKYWATWTSLDNDKTIDVDFTNRDNGFPEPGSGIYAPPEWLQLPSNKVLHMTVARLDSSHLTLMWVNDNGLIQTYQFDRTW